MNYQLEIFRSKEKKVAPHLMGDNSNYSEE